MKTKTGDVEFTWDWTTPDADVSMILNGLERLSSGFLGQTKLTTGLNHVGSGLH